MSVSRFGVLVVLLCCLGVGPAVAQSYEYGYDAAGRLLSVSDGTTMITYEYDPAGNLVTRTVPEPGSLATLAALTTLVVLGRRRRTTWPAVGAALTFALALPTPAGAHDCESFSMMEIALGRNKNYVITADVSESQESQYTLVINSDPSVVDVVPPPNGGLQFKRGVYQVRAVGTGTASIVLDWEYAPNVAQGSCFFTVTVDDPAEDRRTAAAHAQSQSLGDPVNLWTGELHMDVRPDLYIDSIIPLSLARYYSSGLLADAQAVTTLGRNWLHTYEMRLVQNGTRVDITFQRGRGLRFEKPASDWVLIDPVDTPFQLIEDGDAFVLMNPQDWMRWRFDAQGRLVEQRDRNDNTLTFGYDQLNLTTISDPFGNQITLGYDFFQELVSATDGTRTVSYDQLFSGDLQQVTDARGNVTGYSYSAGGLLTSETRPESTVPWMQVYDAEGRVEEQRDSNAQLTTFAYSGTTTTVTNPLLDDLVSTHDADGTLTSATNYAGDGASLGYDAAGRRTMFTDRLGDPTTVTYHAPSGRIASYTDANGDTTTYTWAAQSQGGFTFYNLMSYQLADLSTWSFTYDANGNALTITNPLSEVTTYTYNGRGQVLTRTTPLGETTTYTYDSKGMLATATTPDLHTTGFGYDGLNRLVTLTHPDMTTRTFGYDAHDNLTTYTNELGQTYTYTYDRNDNRIGVQTPLLQSDSFTYDGNDRLQSATDAHGTTSYAYDSLGRLQAVAQPTGEAVTIGWDAAGYPTTMTDGAGAVSTFGYDAEGVPMSITNPLMQTWTFQTDPMGELTHVTTPLGHTSTYVRDERGRLTSVTNDMGESVMFEHGAAGELMAVRLPGGIEVDYTRDAEGNIATVLDPNGEVWTRDYDSQGRPTMQMDPLSRMTTYGYDDRGRPATLSTPTGMLTLGYDDAGNLTQRSYDDGTTLTYGYDGMSRLTSGANLMLDYDAAGYLSHSNGQTMTYDGAGRLASVNYGGVGMDVTYTYNDCGLVESVSDWTGGTTQLVYNAATELTHIMRPNGATSEYSYDASGRLTGVAEMVGPTTWASIALTLNAAGDVTHADRQIPMALPLGSAGSVSMAYDAASQYMGATYDASGRRTAESGRTYTWDEANRMTSYTDGPLQVDFEYDGLGSMTRRTADKIVQTYRHNYALGLGSVTEIGDGVSPLRYFVYLPNGRLLHSIDAETDDKAFYHFDEAGSTFALTDDMGVVTDSYATTPYGESWSASGATLNPFVYHGAFGVMGEGNGLYWMGPRAFDAKSSAFLSTAPLSVPHPQSVNPYAFANRNPIRFSAPRGNGPTEAAPLADIFTPLNPGFLTGSFFEATGAYLEYKRLDQIDQAIKHSRQFPSRNPFPVISDAVKTEKLASRLGVMGNVAGFLIDGVQEGIQAHEEGKGGIQVAARGAVGGGTGLALGAANPAVALIDGLTGENFSHSIKQVYRVPEALLGNARDGRAYTNSARKGDYGFVVQVTNHAGEVYADKGVLETWGGIFAQGFDDTAIALGYAWFGGPEPYTVSKKHIERMRKRRKATRESVERAEALENKLRMRTRQR